MDRLERAVTFCDVLAKQIRKEVEDLRANPNPSTSARLKAICEMAMHQSSLVHDEVRNLNPEEE